MSRKAALPFIIAIFALPVLMLVVRPKPKGIGSNPRASSGKARIVYESVALENTEEWEIITDPKTGIPLKVIGHRKVRYA